MKGPISSVSLPSSWKQSPLVGLFPLFFAPLYLEPTPLCQSRWLHLSQVPRISNYWKVKDGPRRGSICHRRDLGVGESRGAWTKSVSWRWCLSGCSPFASHLLQSFSSLRFNPLIFLSFGRPASAWWQRPTALICLTVTQRPTLLCSYESCLTALQPLKPSQSHKSCLRKSLERKKQVGSLPYPKCPFEVSSFPFRILCLGDFEELPGKIFSNFKPYVKTHVKKKKMWPLKRGHIFFTNISVR